ncbi:MAG: hypothetical protein K0U66_10310, partial [Gammaproteobacteria bacterium]|nr:hypothetical protein [Gammaproteobacteria bacterium]
MVETAVISVTAVNDVPVIANLGGDTLAYTEGDGASVIDQSTNAAVTDVDSSDFDTGTLTVSFQAGSDSAEDVLAIQNQGTGAGQIGVSGSNVTYQGVTIGTFTGGTSGTDLVITLNASADATAVSALTQNITYENTDMTVPTTGARTVRYVLTDGDGGTSANYDTTVTVSGANNGPAMLSLNDNPTFVEDGTAVVLDVDVDVIDVELDALNSGNGNYDGASLTLVRNGGVSSDDVLSFNDGNGITLSGSNLIKNSQIIATFDITTTTGELILTFTDANGEIPTSADVDNILRQLTYSNSSDTPPASVQMNWSFSDGNTGSQGSGGALLSAGNMTVNITAANDAPVNTVPGVQAVAEDTALTISGLSVNDVDGNLSTVQLTVTQGTVTVTLSGSATISSGTNGTSTLTLSGTQVDMNATLASLSYQGTLNYTGADTLTVTSTDSNSATDVDVVNITVGLFVDTTSDASDGDTSSTSALLADKGADGKISLREAIEAANNTAGLDTISFNIADALVDGAHTIDVLSALPTITDAVIIDGTTDSDFAGTPIIELDGSATVGAYGLDITAGDSTVRGLVINNFGSDSIVLAIGDNNVIVGNYIGTDVTGTLAQGGVGSGIKIWAGSTGNVIGGTSVSDRNVISGNNEAGIEIDGVGSNTIQGNYIGTNAAGTGDLGNGADGVIVLNGGSGNVIGGSVAGAGNVISGNDGDGIELTGAGTDSNSIQGNIIGLGADGDTVIGNSADGIHVSVGASSNIIGGTTAGARNVISGNGVRGVQLEGTGTNDNVVTGNYIGTDATGLLDRGNTWGGVLIGNGAQNNTIGGTLAGSINIISGNNSFGIELDGVGTTGNSVLGNYIGTNVTGTTAIANTTAGIRIDNGASSNTIGGTTTSARNVISGNTGDGIYVTDSGTDGNVIQGNFIGTNAAGTAALANTDRGIQIEANAANTQIGGTAAGAGNVIAGNSNDGIILSNFSSGTIVEGNFIGTDLTGALNLGNGTWGIRIANSSGNMIGGIASGAGNTIAYNAQAGIGLQNASGTGNSILGNAIHSNSGIGIDLGVDGVTTNDVGDGDAGANNLQNFPVLFTAHTENGNTTFTGSLNGTASTDYRIEFYSNTLGMEDATGYGEGQTYLGYATVTTDGSGNATINTVLAVTLVASDRITATATVDLGGGNYGDTSEFGQNVIATANDVPVITNLGGDTLAYTEGDGASVIDQSTNAAVTDVDSSDFDSGTLTVSFQAGSDSAEDVLAIQNQGTGAGQIGVSGSNVTYQGVTIGTFAGGTSGTDLVITLNTSADATAVSALTQNITYENTDTDNPTTGSRTVRYVLTDGDGGTSANYDTTVTISGVNDEQSLDMNSGLTLDEGTQAIISNTMLSTSDVEQSTNQIIYAITADSLHGTIRLNTTPLGVGSTFTQADIDAGLLSYQDTDIETTSDSFGFSVDDGLGSVTNGTFNITVTPVNDVPTISNLGGDTLAYTEGDGAAVIDQSTNAAVTDVDSTDFDTGTLTVSFQAGSDSAEDVLAIQNQGTGAGQIGVSGSNVTYQGVTIGTFTGGTSGTDLVITLNASADATAVSALTQNITYENTDTDNPTTGSRTVRYVLTDGDGGTSANYDTTVTFAATNDAPQLTISGVPLEFTEQSPVGIDINIVAADVDSTNLSGATLAISGNYETGVDVLVFTDMLGITGSWNSGTGTLTLSGSATVADYQTALRSIVFQNPSDDPDLAQRTIDVTVTDGTDTSNIASRLVNMTAVADGPVITNLGGDALAYTEGDGASVIDQSTNAAVTDVDSADFDTGTLTVSFTAGSDSAEDVLAIQNQGTGAGQIGVSGSNVTYQGVPIGTFTGGTSGTDLVITLNASADATAVSALTQNITYENTDTDNPTTGSHTVRYVITDGDGGTSANYDTTVTFAAANDVPVITNLGGDTLAYTEGDGASVIDQSTNAAVMDVDSADFDTGTLTVSFTAGSDSAEDVLAIQNQGTGAGQIGVSGSNVTYQGVTIGTFTGGSSGTDLVITLNASADATAVSALTQNITYENTDTDNPTTGSRTV